MRQLASSSIRAIQAAVVFVVLVAGLLASGCPETCTANSDCDAWNTCVGGECGPTPGFGERCDDDQDCGVTDYYVCDSGGVCSLQTTTDQPPGDDPRFQACNPTPPAEGVRLWVPEFGQVCTEWCWAASITMIANYFGQDFYGCQLVSEYVGSPYCCENGACMYPGCNTPAQPEHILPILGRLGISAQGLQSALDEPGLQHELALGRPVMLGYINSFNGHIVVVSGYRAGWPASYHVIDPYYGAFDVSYDQLRWGYAGGSMEWRVTWRGLSTGGMGCPGY